ncbi:MAG TPA: AsmA family protein [Thermodesulfobacteriota bacterium]|nr:AsmA family protein [Thermodesulfobacteriota bacterium]
MKWKWGLGIASAAIVLVVVAVYLILSSYNYNSLKPEITRAVKDDTGRELTLGGDISLKIGFTPALVVKNVSFQNASWGSQPELAKIKRFEIRVRLFPLLSRRIEVKRLILIEPEILFETDTSGKSNLAFDTTKKQDLAKGKEETKAGGNWKLSALTFNELQIEKGRITYIDHELKKTYVGTVGTLMATAASSESPIKLKLKGAYDDNSFEVAGTLCTLAAFVKPNKTWPVNLAVKTENATLTLDGTVKDPLSRRGIELNFTLTGKDLASFKQFSGESYHLRGPFDVSGRIADTSRNVYSISNLKIIQGENDLSGSVELNLAENRPKVTAALSAQKLDLRPYFQGGPDTEEATKHSSKEAGKEDKIFSDRPLPLDTLRRADADVKIQAVQILLPNLPLNSLDMGIVLKDGALTVKPLKAVLGKGSMDGHLSLQSQGKVASLIIVFKIKKFDIGYLAKELKSTEGLKGNLDADIDLNARGSSIAGWMGGLNGKTVLVMGKGRIDKKYIDRLSANLGSNLFHLLNPFPQEAQPASTLINCFVSGFDIKDGAARTSALALNTDDMVVVGEGEINLKTERLNLSFKSVPKGGFGTHATGKLTVRLDELTRPFKLGGTLAHPSLALDLTQTTIEFGQAIGGVVLFGPVAIAAVLVGSSSGDENSCMAAIEAAKKGVRVKKGLVGEVTEDAGKELKKLFGK